MENIDLKDRKILYELDLNCRQSNTQIGKKVGLSRKVVEYRIKRMENDGVIKNYWTEFNTFKLGYNCYRIYIVYQDVDIDKKNEIIEYFANLSNAWAVMSVKGAIDLDVMLWVKDSYEFNQFWNKTLDRYGKYFSESTISILSGGIAYKKTYLVSEETKEDNRVHFILRSGGKTVEIDNIDFKIMNEIAVNSRIPLIELAKELRCSSQKVSSRINNLIEKGVILALRCSIDMSKLGFQNTVLDIYLKDHTQKNNLIQYMQNIPYIEYIIESIGWSDIGVELYTKNFEHLNEIIENIDMKFPGAIRKQDFWASKEYHRLRMLPEMTEADFKKK